jgi:hypothetical protein
LPQADTKRADPLNNPEPYGTRPADQIASMPAADSSKDNNAGKEPDKSTQASGTATTAASAKPKKSSNLLDGFRSLLGRKKKPDPDKQTETVASTARTTQGTPALATVPPARTPAEPARVQQASAQASVAGPGLTRLPPPPTAAPRPSASGPMGVESVFAAAGGVPQPVRYVPVPVVTLPYRTKPPEPRFPEPPRPEVPEPPQLNQKVNSMIVNAFTTPEEMRQMENNAQRSPMPYGYGPMGGYGLNPYAMNPYAMNPYAMNPYAMNPYAMNAAYGFRGPGMLPPTPYAPMGARGTYQTAMYGPRLPGMYPTNGLYPSMPPAGYGPSGMYASVQQAGYSPNLPGMGPQGFVPPGMYGPPVYPAVAQAQQPGATGMIPVAYFTPAGPGGMTPAAGQGFAGGQLTPEAQVRGQMLDMLQNSLYPSQREWAADKLAGCDWRIHADVVQALTTSASKDPAATVRAACIRSLAKMNAASMPVITTIQGLKTDNDLRVRQEVQEALAILIPTGAEK